VALLSAIVNADTKLTIGKHTAFRHLAAIRRASLVTAGGAGLSLGQTIDLGQILRRQRPHSTAFTFARPVSGLVRAGDDAGHHRLPPPANSCEFDQFVAAVELNLFFRRSAWRYFGSVRKRFPRPMKFSRRDARGFLRCRLGVLPGEQTARERKVGHQSDPIGRRGRNEFLLGLAHGRLYSV